MKTVNELLETKGMEQFTVKPSDSVFKALQILAQRQIGALLVVEDDLLVGILSERDYARKVELAGKTARTVLVEEIMTTRVLYVRPEQSLEECMALMVDKNIRHLPVVGNGKLLGIISMRDVVKEVSSEHVFIIKQLENYISAQSGA